MMTLGIKKDGSGWYLFKAIFGVFFSFLLLYGAIPMLVVMFVDYPTLEQATVIEGTLHVEQDPYQKGGRRSLGGMPHPRNYVIDSQGVSHKVFWGVKGVGHGVFDKDFEGLKAKFWFHPWHGVIQDECEKTPEIKTKFAKMFPPEKWGKAVDNPEYASLFKDKFGSKYDKGNEVKFLEYKSRDYIWGLLIFLVVFIYTIYCFIKSFKIKQPA
jgi:hypothetical protein